MTAYAFFVQTCREEHKRQHPEEFVQFQEFSRKCASRWKTMTDREKLWFNQMADEDKRKVEMETQQVVTKKEESEEDERPQCTKESLVWLLLVFKRGAAKGAGSKPRLQGG